MLAKSKIRGYKLSQMSVEVANNRALDIVTSTLDKLDLKEASSDLVIVGGAVLAVCGIKPIENTDLDIAVTERLKYHLGFDKRWIKPDDQSIAVAEGGISVRIGDTYDGFRTVEGDVTAFTNDFDDIYKVPIEELLAEADIPEGSHYQFSPLLRVLDWKAALANASEYKGDKRKHIRDIQRISRHLLKKSKST